MIRRINSIKIKEVFGCNYFNNNEYDVLINVDILDKDKKNNEDYKNIWLSAYISNESLYCQLCDFHFDIKYHFTDDDIKKIKKLIDKYKKNKTN